MFDKLQKLFDSPAEKEFKPRTQGLRSKSDSTPTAQFTAPTVESAERKSCDIGVLIGEDPFKGKLDASRDERIQSKLELLKRLQKELGENE